MERGRKGSVVRRYRRQLRLGGCDSRRHTFGKQRIVLVLPSVRLHDVSKDGRVLLSRESWRDQAIGFFPGDKASIRIPGWTAPRSLEFPLTGVCCLSMKAEKSITLPAIFNPITGTRTVLLR